MEREFMFSIVPNLKKKKNDSYVCVDYFLLS